MEPAEWIEWQQLNPLWRGRKASNDVLKSDYAERPCTDCPVDYARQMRAIGRCNESEP